MRAVAVLALAPLLAPAAAHAQTAVVWTGAPDVAQVAAHYPPRAKARRLAGRAQLSCTVGRGGRLRDCAAIREAPENLGFGDAARAVARDLQVLETGQIHYGSEVQLSVAFDPSMLQPGGFVAPDPAWAALPSAEDFQKTFPKTQNGVNDVRVTLLCSVQPGGALGDCTVASEAPSGQGYGAGALALAPKFKVGPWTAEGFPTAGAKVRVPLHYKLAQVPPPAAAKP